MEEYIVTLKNREDLVDFYDDMETEGGALYIPNRTIDCSLRKPISRSTVYNLTSEEAEELRNDDRVESVVKNIKYDIQLSAFDRTGRFDKNLYSPPNSAAVSWNLLRVRRPYNDYSSDINNWYPQIPNGGSGTQLFINDTISVTETGENVDIIVVDYASVIPTHPEFAVNVDGTGGSRVQEINWHQYTPTVQGDNPGLSAQFNFLIQNYSYTPYSTGNTSTDTEINHGCSCASLAAGNTNGSAFKANIYSISVFDSWQILAGNIDANGSLYLTLWDYIRAFHNSKTVNPATGRKNPTVVTASYGYIYYLNEGTSSWPYYAQRDGFGYGNSSNTSGSLSHAQMENAEIVAETWISGNSPNGFAVITIENDTIRPDVADAIADGIHVFAAGGNQNAVCEKLSSSFYTNSYFLNNARGTVRHKSRGFLPDEGVLVGALSGTREGYQSAPTGRGEMPNYYSSRGRGIDLYAASNGCVAAVNSSTGVQTQDPRNSSFYFGIFGGTSAACPNVAGIAACVLERFPDFSPAQLKEYLIQNMSRDRDTHNEIGDDGKVWPGNQVPATNQDNYSFHQNETPRAIMYVKNLRPAEGRIDTKEIYGPRKSSGKVYPRTKTLRNFRETA